MREGVRGAGRDWRRGLEEGEEEEGEEEEEESRGEGRARDEEGALFSFSLFGPFSIYFCY